MPLYNQLKSYYKAQTLVLYSFVTNVNWIIIIIIIIIIINY